MPFEQPYAGKVGRTLEESEPWWSPLPSGPEGAPNVVVVLLDDVGYAQFGCYGSDIATPTFGIESTINFILMIFLAFALVFQTPIIMVALARIGVINSAFLRRNRKYFLFGFFVFRFLVL